MAAGDLVVADYQAELQATLMGVTTSMLFEPPGITGLDIPAPKTQDVPLDGDPGAYAPPDLAAPRILTLPFVILGADAAGAMGVLSTMDTVWAQVAADVPLYLRLPGWGKFHVNGRPRGMTAQLADLKNGVIHLLCTFYCLDPTINPG